MGTGLPWQHIVSDTLEGHKSLKTERKYTIGKCIRFVVQIRYADQLPNHDRQSCMDTTYNHIARAREFFFVSFRMDSFEIYQSIIDRTIEQVRKSRESSSVRLDIVDGLQRKWLSNLESACGRAPSDRAAEMAANRAKYMTYPGTKPATPVEVKAEPQPNPVVPQSVDDDDEFEDEFGDAEIIHTTEVGRKMAEVAIKSEGPGIVSTTSTTRRVVSTKKKEIINAEDLNDESLNETDYDTILEPSDCEVRVFGQTEVCETVVGPRRSDSRWIVTILNGIVKTSDGKETLFRTAKQVMPHLHQHQ